MDKFAGNFIMPGQVDAAATRATVIRRTATPR